MFPLRWLIVDEHEVALRQVQGDKNSCEMQARKVLGDLLTCQVILDSYTQIMVQILSI